jgi:hypothetical protein
MAFKFSFVREDGEKSCSPLCILPLLGLRKHGPFIKKYGVEGKVARIKGELEEVLPGWEIIVGPREASEIPAYLPKLVKQWKN